LSVVMNEHDFFSGSPMLCSSPSGSSQTWSDAEEPEFMLNSTGSPLAPMQSNATIQQYQYRIQQLEAQLREANNRINLLQAQLGRKKNDTKPKAQSRYWTDEEHALFLEALSIYGPKDVKSISNHVGTRNTTQVRTHSQKYFLRLERERKKEDEKKKKEGNFEQDQFEKFLAAVRITSHETDFERKTDLIHDKYMPDTPKETIKAWLFVHTKTVEKIQSSEANQAANSVGIKRLRSNSNPVSVGLSSHRHSGVPAQRSTSQQFVAAIPTSSLAQSGVSRPRAQSFLSGTRKLQSSQHRLQSPHSPQNMGSSMQISQQPASPQMNYHNSPQLSNFDYNIKLEYPPEQPQQQKAHPHMFRRAPHMDGRPRPLSAPNYIPQFFDPNANFFESELDFQNHLPQYDIKPFIPASSNLSNTDPSCSPFGHYNQ